MHLIHVIFIHLIIADHSSFASGFKPFLEAAPELRQIVLHFQSCNYTQCLRALDALKVSLPVGNTSIDHL